LISGPSAAVSPGSAAEPPRPSSLEATDETFLPGQQGNIVESPSAGISSTATSLENDKRTDKVQIDSCCTSIIFETERSSPTHPSKFGAFLSPFLNLLLPTQLSIIVIIGSSLPIGSASIQPCPAFRCLPTRVSIDSDSPSAATLSFLQAQHLIREPNRSPDDKNLVANRNALLVFFFFCFGASIASSIVISSSFHSLDELYEEAGSWTRFLIKPGYSILLSFLAKLTLAIS
jgi:hypothetical protein